MRPPGNRRPRSGPGDEPAAGLTGGGPSQLGVNGSMRARDVSRPREDDVERAERIVQVSYRPHARSNPPRPEGPRPAEAQEPGSGGSEPVSS